MTLVGKILRGVVQTTGRLADQIFTGGLIHNTLEDSKIISASTKVLHQSEKGKIDFPKWFSMILISLPLWLMIAIKLGWLTLEEAGFINDNVGNLTGK